MSISMANAININSHLTLDQYTAQVESLICERSREIMERLAAERELQYEYNQRGDNGYMRSLMASFTPQQAAMQIDFNIMWATIHGFK